MAGRSFSAKQWQRLGNWVLVNWLGLAIASLTTVYLHAAQQTVFHHEVAEWSQLFRKLAICGVGQGLVFGAVQAIALRKTRVVSVERIVLLLAAIVSSMALSMAFPAYKLSTYPQYLEAGQRAFIDAYSDYWQIGWVLSWTLAGLFWGAIVGRTPKQKIMWALLNAIAYFCWGVASFDGAMLLSAVLDFPPDVPFSQVLSQLAFILPILGLGSLLNTLIFQSLIRKSSGS